MLRRVIVAVALCGLLASCSGKSAPSAAERSTCKTVRAEFAHLPKNGPLPEKEISESERFLAGATSERTTVFVRINFVHQLIRSGDPALQRLGSALQRDTGVAYPIRQLDARCAALGL